MDYDPEWMHGDADFMGGDDDFGSENRDLDHTEYDDLGNPIFIAAAAGFGYHMSQDERESLEESLEQEERSKAKVKKIPLSSRHTETKRNMPPPFERWAYAVNKGLLDINEPIESVLTAEEKKLIYESEKVEDDEL